VVGFDPRLVVGRSAAASARQSMRRRTLSPLVRSSDVTTPAASSRLSVSIAVAREMPARSAMVAAERHTGRSTSSVAMASAITTSTMRAVESSLHSMMALSRSWSFTAHARSAGTPAPRRTDGR